MYIYIYIDIHISLFIDIYIYIYVYIYTICTNMVKVAYFPDHPWDDHHCHMMG